MEEETVEHLFCNCSSYKLQRGVLKEELKTYNLKELLDVVKIVNKELFGFLIQVS